MQETNSKEISAPQETQTTASVHSQRLSEDVVAPNGKPESSNQYLAGFSLFAVIGSISLVCLLVLLDMSILSTATPHITTQFHSLSDVGWYAGAYQLASAALQPLTGKVYAHFRMKISFLTFLFVFELGSLICGIATSSPMLIAGRAVAGLGSSGLINGGITIIAVVAPLDKRPLYTGIVMGVAQLGILSGPLIGGALTQYTTWRWCFYLNLPLGGAIAALLLPQRIPDIGVQQKFGWKLIRETVPKLDLPGFVLFAPAAVMLLLALQYGSAGTYAWGSSTIIGLFVGAAVTAIVFLVWEYRTGAEAMVPTSLMHLRVVWASCIYSGCIMSGVIGASFYLPIYFQAVKGVTPTISGVDLLPSILSSIVVAVSSGAIISRTGYYLPWALCGGAVTSIGYGLLSTLRTDTGVGKWIGYQILAGAGRGAGMQMPMVAVQTLLARPQIPTALAMVIFFQNLSAAITIVISTTIFTQELSSNLRHYAPDVNLQKALAAGGGAGAVRNLVPHGDPKLRGVLLSYSKSVGAVFYLLAAFAVVSVIVGWGMGWGDVRKKVGATKNIVNEGTEDQIVDEEKGHDEAKEKKDKDLERDSAV